MFFLLFYWFSYLLFQTLLISPSICMALSTSISRISILNKLWLSLTEYYAIRHLTGTDLSLFRLLWPNVYYLFSSIRYFSDINRTLYTPLQCTRCLNVYICLFCLNTLHKPYYQVVTDNICIYYKSWTNVLLFFPLIRFYF